MRSTTGTCRRASEASSCARCPRVDIALWAPQGPGRRAAHLEAAGRCAERVPVSVAGGYPGVGPDAGGPGRGARGLRREGLPDGQAGGRRARRGHHPAARARRVLGPDIALAHDVHWAFRDLPSVVPTVRTWEDIGIAFLEVPFPSELVALVRAACASRPAQRLALGEDTVGRWAFRDLLDRRRAGPAARGRDRRGRALGGGQDLRPRVHPGRAGVPPRLPGGPRPPGRRLPGHRGWWR